MRIQNNITAMNTHRQYGIANSNVARSAEKLASGYRINRAGDDAAGLAISEKMRAQIRGLNMASKNSQDAISLVQTAEGALQSTHNILQRMRELAVQSSSDTNEKVIDRGALQQEFAQLIAEIDDTASKTQFNQQNILDGTFSKTLYSVSAKTGTLFSASSGSVVLGNANSGAYDFKIIQSTVGYVPPADNAASVANTPAGSVTAVALSGFTPSATASLNGDWKLSYNEDTNQYTLSLGDRSFQTTATYTGPAGAETGMVLAFAGLGTLTVTLDGSNDMGTAIGKAAVAGDLVGTEVKITGGVDEQVGTTKFYAQLSGANLVEVKVGDTYASFDNGITVGFAALTSAVLTRLNVGSTKAPDDATFAAANYVGTITVESRAGSGLIIQTGANQGDELSITIDKMNATFLGVKYSNIASRESASYAITQTNKALNQVSTQRAALGALQNRLEFKISNLDNSAENLSAAESRIRDVDMAKEMTEFSKKNILVQAATAMLAQANAAPQNVLSLLR